MTKGNMKGALTMKAFVMFVLYIIETLVTIFLQVLSVLLFFGVPLLIVAGIWNLLF